MNLAEKIEMAKQLEKLGVDIIEAGFAIASPMDHKSVQAIAAAVEHCTVASLAAAPRGTLTPPGMPVKEAKYPRIHVFSGHQRHSHGVQAADDPGAGAPAHQRHGGLWPRGFCDDIEFSAEDASRSDWAFLAQCYSNAVAAGATTLNVPDTVGYSTPQEMADLITYLKAHCRWRGKYGHLRPLPQRPGHGGGQFPGRRKAGATQVECTVNGIGGAGGQRQPGRAGHGHSHPADFYDAETGINTKQIYRSSKLLSNITGVPIPPSKAIVGANAFAHESGIHQHGVIANAQTYEIMKSTDVGIPQNTMVLGKALRQARPSGKAGIHGLRAYRRGAGRRVRPVQGPGGQEKEHHRQRHSRPWSSTAGACPRGDCRLVSHVVNTGHGVPNISCIKLQRGNEELEDVAIGSGPLDASFKAINRMLHMDGQLEKLQPERRHRRRGRRGRSRGEGLSAGRRSYTARAFPPILSNPLSGPMSTVSTKL